MGGGHIGLHISRVEIENFRNFAHLVIDPFPAAAVVVGENGVGKSNFLHALRILLDPALPDSARLLRAEDFHEGPSGAPMTTGAIIRISVDLAGYDDDVDALSVLADSPLPGPSHRARLTYEYRPRAGTTILSDDEGVELQDRLEGLASADYEFVVFGGLDSTNDARHLRRDIAIRVLPALRDAESDLQTWRRNPLRDILERLPLDPANLDATARLIANAMDSLRTDPSVVTLESNLAVRLLDMMGARNPVAPAFGFASAEADDLVRFIRLFIDTARRRTVGDTSLGGANVLYLALLLEALAEQRAANAFVAMILAVEEPEAHLHVTMQRLLFRYLLRSEPALILTSHSPHIAAVAPLASYVLLRSTPEGTKGSTTAALTVTDQQRADLERYMDQTRAEVLFATHVILVEGLAETYVLPALAHACGFNLDEYGVVIASVQGTDFAPYVALLGETGLDVPYVIVTDGDIEAALPGQREGGLRRAVKLAPDDQRADLDTRLADFLAEEDRGRRVELRGALVADVSRHGVFVGVRTLEVDLCALVPEEIIGAYRELPHPGPGAPDVEAGVRNEAAGGADQEVREAFLDRISDLGKGRFAQRLAGHIVSGTIPERIEAMGSAPEDHHVLAALNAVSLQVRGKPLVEAWSQVEE